MADFNFDEQWEIIKKNLSEMDDVAREKYAALRQYIDTHDKEQIKADLKHLYEKGVNALDEGVDQAKDGLGERLSDVRDDLGEAMDKVKNEFDELRKRYHF